MNERDLSPLAPGPVAAYIVRASIGETQVDEPTRVKADIVPYSREYERDVLSWIESEETLAALTRGKEFPPPDDLIESWQRKGVQSYLLFSAGKPVAYAELWDRPAELAREIAHLLVAPTSRGRGYGVKMLQLLYERAAQAPQVAKVVLNLYREDEIALGCYLKAGFELAGTSSYTMGLRMARMVR